MKIELRDMRSAGAAAKLLERESGRGPLLVIGFAKDRPNFEGGFPMFAFNPNNTTAKHEIESPHDKFTATVFVGNDPFSFTLNGIASGDTVIVQVLTLSRVSVSTRHAKNHVPDCFAQCPDGTQGVPCVDCDLGQGRVIKICC